MGTSQESLPAAAVAYAISGRPYGQSCHRPGAWGDDRGRKPNLGDSRGGADPNGLDAELEWSVTAGRLRAGSRFGAPDHGAIINHRPALALNASLRIIHAQLLLRGACAWCFAQYLSVACHPRDSRVTSGHAPRDRVSLSHIGKNRLLPSQQSRCRLSSVGSSMGLLIERSGIVAPSRLIFLPLLLFLPLP